MDEAGEGNITGLPDVPPEWVPLIGLVSKLARWLGVKQAIIAPDLADAVWTGSLRPAHRIAGVVRYGGRHPQLPAGLSEIDAFSLNLLGPHHWQEDVLKFGGRVIADDWDVSKTDRQKGTVAGREFTDGTTERLDIEINWQAAKSWAGRQVKRWKQQEREATRALAAEEPKAPAKAPPPIQPPSQIMPAKAKREATSRPSERVRMVTKADIIKDALIRIHNGETSQDHPTPTDLGKERFDNKTGKLVAVNIRSHSRPRLQELAQKEAVKEVSEPTFKRGLSRAMAQIGSD